MTPTKNEHGETVREESLVSTEPEEVRFHRRTLVIGAVLVAFLSYVVMYVDLVVQQIQLGILQFASGAVGAFFLVYFVTRVLRHSGYLKWMNAADLLVLYVMLFTGVFVCSRGLLDKLLPTLTYANNFANTSNQFRNLVFPHLNPSLVVGDPHGKPQQSVAAGYYNGITGGQLPWNAWVIPCLSWFILFALIMFSFLCLSTILRKQWSDVEKLTFPQTILPLQIFDERASSEFFRNKLTWAGILVPVLIYGINGTHENFPTVPEIPLLFNSLELLGKVPPWDQLEFISICLSFSAIGFAYLLPTELLFSLWFFFALTRLGDVVIRAHNFDMPGMPMFPSRAYLGYQSAGAYVALAFSFFYSGRQVIGERLKKALRFERCEDDELEILPQRTALWGVIFAFVGIVAWCVWAGMNAWFAAAVFAIYLGITSVVLARGVAEAGLLVTETSFRPGDVIGLFLHQSSWGGGNVVGLSLLNAVFFRDMRGLFLGLYLDAEQMAGGIRMRRSGLLLPIAVGTVIAFIFGVASHLHIAYGHGAASLYSYGAGNAGWALTEASSILQRETISIPSAGAWFAVGIAVAGILIKLRAVFVGFPLVPIAYALAPSWGLGVLWFPFLLIWVIKSLILRYGSSKLYRSALPFFLGLIIGEVGSIAVWSLLATVFKISAPLLPI